MARPTIEQSILKAKAVDEAFEELKEASTPIKNLASLERIIDLANENYSGKLKSEISYTTLKSPSSKKFKEIKAKYEKFRREHRENKNIVPKKSKKEIIVLSEQVSNLVLDVVKITDEKLLLDEQIVTKDATIKKLKSEIHDLQSRLSKCEDKD